MNVTFTNFTLLNPQFSKEHSSKFCLRIEMYIICTHQLLFLLMDFHRL